MKDGSVDNACEEEPYRVTSNEDSVHIADHLYFRSGTSAGMGQPRADISRQPPSACNGKQDPVSALETRDEDANLSTDDAESKSRWQEFQIEKLHSILEGYIKSVETLQQKLLESEEEKDKVWKVIIVNTWSESITSSNNSTDILSIGLDTPNQVSVVKIDNSTEIMAFDTTGKVTITKKK